MYSHRKHRRGLAGWVILLLLFMQAATAAYACPQRDVIPQAHAGMSGCEGSGSALDMDSEHPLLCIADCEQNAHAASQAGTADTPTAGVLLYMLALAPAMRTAPSPLHPSTHPAARGDPPPGWPPPYLLHRVFRN